VGLMRSLKIDLDGASAKIDVKWFQQTEIRISAVLMHLIDALLIHIPCRYLMNSSDTHHSSTVSWQKQPQEPGFTSIPLTE